jgi:voltage-gated potassium channel
VGEVEPGEEAMAEICRAPPAVSDESHDGPVADRRKTRRRLLGSIVRVGLLTALLCTLYAVAPLDRQGAGIARQMASSLLVLAAVVAWQIIAVMRSPYPRLRAVEAVAVSVPLLIILFASAYVAMSGADERSFTEHLTRLDAVYFTVTVLATVGFGDISATTAASRALVTVQMLADLLLIGVIAKVLLGAVQRRRRALTTKAQPPSPESRS